MPAWPIDAATMKAGIGAWLATQGVWGWANRSKRPEPPRPYIMAGFMTTPRGVGHSEAGPRVDAARVTIAAAQTYTLSLVSGDVAHAAGAGETVTQIRDALVALIAGSTASGTDVIVLPSTETLSSVSPEPDLRIKCAITHRRAGTAVLQVDAYTDDPTSAEALAGTLRASLEHELHRETLNAAGWGVAEVTAVRDIPEFVDGVWRGRSGFDVMLNCTESSLEIQDIIDTVNIRNDTLSPPVTTTVILP